MTKKTGKKLFRAPVEKLEKAPEAEGKYLQKLVEEGNEGKVREYERYMKEHQTRLRRLEREAAGDFVPGDYDGGY